MFEALLQRYHNNKVRKRFEIFFDSRLFYSWTILLTIICLIMAFNTRSLYFRMSALENCYNQTQIIPGCYDMPQCYNQTELQRCYVNASYAASDAYGMAEKDHTRRGLAIAYTCLLAYFIFEAILRFVMSPANEFDAFYDLCIIVADCYVTFSALAGSDSYIYFGIALPIRIGLFIADVDILRPTLYKISLAVPKLIYLGMLFFSIMYFFGIATFLIFSAENNPTCVSCNKYFPDLQKSLITMLEVSMWFNWGDVVDDLVAENLFSEIAILTYFTLFGVVTTFVVFNVFYAVVCEVVLDYYNYSNKIPANASTSFINRVIMHMLFQFVEIVLTEEDQKKIENEELAPWDRLKLLGRAYKQYFITLKREIWSATRETEFETLISDDKDYGTIAPQEEEEVDLKSVMKKLNEVLTAVQDLNERVKKLET